MEKAELPPGVSERIAFFEAPANLIFLVAGAFLVGVLAASAGWNAYVVLIVSFFAGFALIFMKRVPLRAALIFPICIFLGALYYHFYLNLEENQTNLTFGTILRFSGVVVSEPKFTEKTQYFFIDPQRPLAGTVKVVTRRVPEFRYGDLLDISGKIQPPKEREPAAIVFPEIARFESGRGFSLKEKLLNLKLLFIGQFRAVLPHDSAALLSGLTFGYQSDFRKAFKEKMAASGTTHLVALSGYNIAILVLAVSRTFRSFLSRHLTFLLTVITILLFVLMVGAEASVVRAAIMGFLVLLARETGNIYSFRNAVTLAAALMVLFDPTILVFNIGFQLSFLSLLGIVYLEPALRRLFRMREDHASFLGWRENAVTTLSAQLAVAPLIAASFGEFSLTSLFANILILEVVPLTMALGFFLAGVGILFGALGNLVGWLVNLFLVYEIGVINVFSVWRIAAGGAITSWFFIAFYYLILLGGILYSRNARKI